MGMVLISYDNLPRDDSSSLNFQVISSKLPHFFQKFQFVIIGAGQIFKSHQQNCFIFGKSLPCDNKGCANFQVKSSKLPQNFSL